MNNVTLTPEEARKVQEALTFYATRYQGAYVAESALTLLQSAQQRGAPAVSEQGEREAFEAWARDRGYGVIRAANGPYIWDSTEKAWGIWQARAILARAGIGESRHE